MTIMKKCLVTNLIGSVDNEYLLKVGELAINYHSVENPTSKTQVCRLQFNKETTLRIAGDGFFTDKTLSQNLGKTKTLVAGALEDVYTSNGEYLLILPNKYNLTWISFTGSSESNTFKDRGNKELYLADLSFSNDLSILDLSCDGIYGDVSCLSGKASTTMLQLIIGSSNVYGDITSFANCINLNYFNTYDTKITGDISVFKNMSLLSGGYASNIHGDISAFANTRIESFHLTNQLLTGDIALVPGTCKFLEFKNDKGSSFTWSNRPSNCNILALNGNVYIDNIDKMLQDQASCQATDFYNKLIEARGSRTSVSDEAVATLQSKGYTVAITPA